jgi:peptidoglycan/xylan/chitin deacetylase (PgdA/CDA1 family)
VALTFDAEHPDRPSQGQGARALIDGLRQLEVAATFFVQGRWAEAYPELAARLAADGHLVGSHSFYHARMSLFDRRGFNTDVRAAERAIRLFAGTDPRPWFRMPFGSGADRAVLVDRLADLGYRHVGWHVSGLDWHRRRATRGVEEAVVAGATTHGDGAIVLLHTWPDATAAALPGMVSRLRAAGAELVRVDQLDVAPDLTPLGDQRPRPLA